MAIALENVVRDGIGLSLSDGDGDAAAMFPNAHTTQVMRLRVPQRNRTGRRKRLTREEAETALRALRRRLNDIATTTQRNT
jgi:hypothetical protein